MLIKLQNIYLLLIIIVFYPAFGMDLPLCTEEKQLFLWAVELASNEVGLSLIIEQIKLAQENDEVIYVTLKLYNDDSDKNPLFKNIYEKVMLKDEAFGYIPHAIKKNGKTLPLNGKPTNYLGNYTRYWHKEGKHGPYISVKSKFKNIPLLQEALAEIEKK